MTARTCLLRVMLMLLLQAEGLLGAGLPQCESLLLHVGEERLPWRLVGRLLLLVLCPRGGLAWSLLVCSRVKLWTGCTLYVIGIAPSSVAFVIRNDAWRVESGRI